MKIEIKFCPNCKSDLTKTAKLAQDVRECKKCNTRFYMLICNTG